MKEATYWLNPHPAAKNYSNKPLPPKTDVLVVGSGYTGVVTALQLKKVNVDIHEYVEAEKIDRAGGKFKVTTSRGSILAERIVVGTMATPPT